MTSQQHSYEHFDPQQVQEIADNDEELIKEIITIFLATNPANIADLEAAIAAGDRVQVEFTGHKLIGAFRLIGAEQLALYAEELGQVKDDTAKLTMLQEQIKTGSDKLMEEISEYSARM